MSAYECNFTPAPVDRTGHDGWSEIRQRQFIAALGTMGSVGKALKAVGMGLVSAYALRKRPGAEDFARAWDRALANGRVERFSYAMARALHGLTVIKVRRHGVVEVTGAADMGLINASLREAPR